MLTSLSLPQLQTLRYYSYGLQLTALEGLLLHVGHQLQQLNIRVVFEPESPDKPPCICMLFRYCPQLKHLSYITDLINMKACAHGTQQQRVAYHSLESLELDRHEFSMASVLPLLQQCPQLRRLCLSTYREWNIDLLCILDICPRLQSLEVVLSIELRKRIRDRLVYWGEHLTPCNNNIYHSSTSGLINLIITSLHGAYQFYALNTIVNLHHQTIRLIEVLVNKDNATNTGRNHVPIHIAPPNLEKLDFDFYDFQYTTDDLACLIRPHLEQCSRLTWVSLKAHRSSYPPPPLPHWAFEALAQLSDLRHLRIQMANDPNGMIYFLKRIKSHNNTKLESLFYYGDWASNMDMIRLIAELPSLRSLALSLSASIDHISQKVMVDCLQLLQHAPSIQSLALANVKGFGSQEVFQNIGLMPHLQQLYIVTYASTSKEWIRHIADREPPLRRLVVIEWSYNDNLLVGDADLEDALEYARTKIKIVEGRHVTEDLVKRGFLL